MSQLVLSRLLVDREWPADLANLTADAVGCHHGERASQQALLDAELEVDFGSGSLNETKANEWIALRLDIFEQLAAVLQVGAAPSKESLDGPEFMLLAGLTSFADWIGSNAEHFTFGRVSDCADLDAWYARSRRSAESALTAIGWDARTPLAHSPLRFDEVFPEFTPRPLQLAVEAAIAEAQGPITLLVEAPMGEGKTEAALYAHLELQRRFGHRGLYVALPTKATGNAMFERTLQFLRQRGMRRDVDLQLLHGAKLLNESFSSLRFNAIHDGGDDGNVRAATWFTSKKRALLSEYGVGTVDQAIVTILPVRHNFVRLWGLANRVVILDEIHAYDAYTGTLLLHLMRWLQSLGSSVVLLSATLSPSIRARLASFLGADEKVDEVPYPRISVYEHGRPVRQQHVMADPERRQSIIIRPIGEAVDDLRATIDVEVPREASALALVNTVQRAQALYQCLGDGAPLRFEGSLIGKELADGTQVVLFHARFAADDRQAREEAVLQLFGRSATCRIRRVLIATQVAEQSLDLDFDVMISDLAPVDLLLQRAGRLWRHKKSARPVKSPILFVSGIDGDEPPSFGKPLWWGKVYREDLLLRTWIELRSRLATGITLPDDIDDLVRRIYEGEGEIPPRFVERIDELTALEGVAIAQRHQAELAVIGSPGDDSWNDSSRYVLYDEDSTGIHRSLMAQTRLGDESVVVVPLWPKDGFEPGKVPDADVSRNWYGRGISLSRRTVVQVLRRADLAPGWARSPLLRGCAPLQLDDEGRWMHDRRVRVDEELGIVYEAGEVK